MLYTEESYFVTVHPALEKPLKLEPTVQTFTSSHWVTLFWTSPALTVRHLQITLFPQCQQYSEGCNSTLSSSLLSAVLWKVQQRLKDPYFQAQKQLFPYNEEMRNNICKYLYIRCNNICRRCNSIFLRNYVFYSILFHSILFLYILF